MDLGLLWIWYVTLRYGVPPANKIDKLLPGQDLTEQYQKA